MPEDDDEFHVVFSDRLRVALDSWKARRDAEWPDVPRPAAWRDVTRCMTAHLHNVLERFAPHLSEAESEEVDAFLRRYDLEPLCAFARSRASSLPPDGGGLAVLSAAWGKGRRTVDVTQALASRIAGGRLVVRASNSLAGDPAVGVVKRLTVKYVWKGRQRSRSVSEWETLTLP